MASKQTPHLYLGADPALLYWRAVREGRLEMPQPSTTTRVGPCASGSRDISEIDLSPLGICLTNLGAVSTCHPTSIELSRGGKSLALRLPCPDGIALPPGPPSPLEVLVSSRNQSRRGPATRCRVLGTTLPSGSFFEVSDRILVPSPELSLLLACTHGHMLPAIELACEWCGSYAFTPLPGSCLTDLDPLTSTEKLAAFLKNPRLPAGRAILRDALKWTANGLASPRETELYLVLVLPPRLGGFGLPLPKVNEAIKLKGTTAERLTADGTYVIDLLFGDTVGVEYDGEEDHEATPAAVTRDRSRRSVLAALGYQVIIVTRHDLRNPATLRRKAEQIAHALGVTLPTFSSEDAAAHAALVSWLFDPSHDHLPFGCWYQ